MAEVTPQVSSDHYGPSRYDERHRWLAYWYQIQAVSHTGAGDILEIGRGTGVVSEYLRRRMGLKVTSFDFDEALEPDVVGDVRRLDDFFGPDSFDAVCAFQVLEHLPFEDFRPTLEKMATVAKKYVVISLPHWGNFLHLRLQISRWQFVFGRKIARPHTWRFDGQHHWEIGTRGYSLDRIVKVISSMLDIDRRYFCPDYPYHYFFVCRKRV